MNLTRLGRLTPLFLAATVGSSSVGCARAAAPAASSANAPAAQRDDDASSKSSSTDAKVNRQYGWVLVGVGAAAGVIAIGTSILMIHDLTLRNDHCGADKTCDSTGLDAASEYKAAVVPNAIAWGAAALGLGIGTFLVLTSPTDKDEKPPSDPARPDAPPPRVSIGVGPNPGGAGLTLRGEF